MLGRVFRLLFAYTASGGFAKLVRKPVEVFFKLFLDKKIKLFQSFQRSFCNLTVKHPSMPTLAGCALILTSVVIVARMKE